MFGGVLVIARFLLVPELDLWYALALLAGMTAAVGWIAPAEKLSLRTRAIVRVTLCIAALGLSLVPAAQEFAAQKEASQGNPYQSFQP